MNLHMENFSRERKHRRNQMEIPKLKSIRTGMESLLDGLNSILETTEERAMN